MGPKLFVVAVDIDPVGLHVGEEGGAVLGRKDGGYVCVAAGGVAGGGFVGAVAVIGPFHHHYYYY